MRKNHITAIISVFVLLFLFQGCSCSKKAKKTGPLNSTQLIGKDLNQKKINFETSLVYGAYAIFGSSKLPKQYRSKEEIYDGDRVFGEIMLNWDKLSNQTKEKLAPFYANPSNKNSDFWKIAKKPQADFDLIPSAHAGPQIPNEILPYFDAANGKIKIWFFEKDRTKAKTVLRAFDVDKIYEKETSYMGREPLQDYAQWGDDSKIDIYLVDMVARGACVGVIESGNKAKTHIFLNRKYSGKYLKSYAAHELFHSIQYAFDVTEPVWWKEMTAAWSETLIYPDHDTEHLYLKNFFKDFFIYYKFTTVNDRHEYGQWVFPLYLTQQYGQDIIKKTWAAAEPAGKKMMQALDETLPNGLDHNIKEFAAWVWNQKPVKKLKDKNKYLNILPDIEKTRIKENNARSQFSQMIEPLGIGIERFFIKEADKAKIRSVDFDLSGLNQKYPYLGIWAIIKVKNKDPIKEDWSGTGYHSFCFDLPEEDLEEVIIIIANTHRSKSKDAADTIKYQTHKAGCSAKLNLSWQKMWDIKADMHLGNIPKPGFIKTKHKSNDFGHMEVTFKEVLKDPQYPEHGKEFVPQGGFSHTFNYYGSGSAGVYGVYEMGGNAGMASSASDTWNGTSQKSKKEYATLRFYLHEPEKDEEEISQEDLNMVPAALRQQYQMLKNLQPALENSLKIERPKEGELQMDVRLYFGNLPATSRGTGGGGQTTYTPPEIEFKQIFKENETSVQISKELMNTDTDGRLTISGTLRLKP
ncbi:MAG: hypothetical protein GY858_06220 [Candidatus Omnitrophica bacterium]|nr:hypothetical protein [Candidatus Omnitrophota bacterium]